ncbi:hypothetical protein BN7_4894 [Wickerhamomyces ciferrii]|uniref:Protein Zds1 C-terminal domain-containing protein n=1 Tax=Wickerhamomyces ciferrii (strain ATCC 14091 / BCRC 22168 / CBS 111 / JCM 3599 / NBRC 0793 / NRRL Y-1031 F-60-10) TaxID=1206466 RepID=K0KTH3_WICCF|nr:uncharacterized protein BN7_4894 [Wickerhamomyces ciferrii]CCH45312.1 hypothetical protein BN7_4894 [Wickerhamomyces ciferrii]
MSKSDSTGELTPDYNEQLNKRNSSQHDSDLKKAKRKSNAYMAAEALEQERDAVTALKRLSIGRSSINVDPDLPYGVDGDFNYNDYSRNHHHRRKSSQSSDSSLNTTLSSTDDDKEKTLTEDDDPDKTRNDDSNNHQNQDQDDDDDVKLNAEKLLWVPAKSHPNIAPDQFRRHVQSTIDDMNHRLGDKAHLNTTLTSKDSIPSLKELTDELDRLSEMAGLAATDAVTLARSLSSASGSSSLLLDKDENRFFQDSQNTPSTSPTSTNNNNSTTPSRSSSLIERHSEDEADQDAPLLGEGSNTLRRNKWTTYSRSHRGGKDKPRPKAHSPLADEHKFIPQSTSQEKELNLEKELPPNPPISSSSTSISSSSSFDDNNNEIPMRNVPLQDPQKQKILADQSRGRSNNLSRSQSDPSTAIPPQKRTNHSRNRHAGSTISIDPTSQSSSSLSTQSNQRRVVSHESTNQKPYQRQISQNQSTLNEIQNSRPLPTHPQQKPVPSIPQNDQNDQTSRHHHRSTHQQKQLPQTHQQQNLTPQQQQQLQHRHQLQKQHRQQQQHQQQQQQNHHHHNQPQQQGLHHHQQNPQRSQHHPQQHQPLHSNHTINSKESSQQRSISSGSTNAQDDVPTKTLSPTTSSFGLSPSSSPTSSSFNLQQSQQSQQQQIPQTTPEKPEKTKKDNSFLKMFKKKRSPSPKNQKTLPSIGSKTSPTVNDENRSPTGTQFNIPVSPEKKQQVQLQDSVQKSPPRQQQRPTLKPSKSSQFKILKSSKSDEKSKTSNLQESVTIVSKKDEKNQKDSKLQQSPTGQQQISPESQESSPPQQDEQSQSLDPKNQQQFHQQTGQALNEEQHRIQKETLSKKLSLENMKKSSKPNAPVQFTDSAFGFPLPPLSHSTVVMLDYRFPIHVERALYRLSHLKLANPRRPLRQQVLLSNFMYSYLNLVNHTLYLQQLDENQQEFEDDQDKEQGQISIEL